MSRTKGFLGAVGVGLLSQVVYAVTGFVLTPFLLDRVGQHDYGLWAVALQVTTYLGFLDLGVVALLPREVAVAAGRGTAAGDGGAEVRALVGRTTRIVLWQIPLIAAASLLIWVLMPNEWSALRGPMAAIFAAFVFFFPARVVHAVLTGLQDQSFAGWLQLGSYLFTTAVMVALVLGGAGLPAFAASGVAAQVIVSVGWWARLRAKFPWALPDRLPPSSWREAREYLGRSIHASVSQLAVILIAGTDIVIVGKLLGPAAVVPYIVTGKLIAVMANQPHLFMQVALPGLAELRAGESRSQVYVATTALGQALLTLSGALFCLVLLVNKSFVAWWVDPAQFGGVALTLCLLLHMTLRHWNTVLSFTCFALGDERRLSYLTLADGATSVLASLLLVRVLGPVGAPIAGIAGAALVSIPNNLRALSVRLDVPVSKLTRPTLGWLLRCAPLALACFAIARVWPPPTFLGLAAATIVVLAVYAVVMTPVALRPPLGDYARPRLAPLLARLQLRPRQETP